MMKQNPYQAYKQQSVMTMTPGDMLMTVYDALLKQMNFAKQAFAQNNLSEINVTLQKAQEILGYLRTTLDFNYPVAKDLDALYDYFIYELIQVNIKKNPKALDEIIPMITELRETYLQADKKVRLQEAEATG